MLLTTLTLPFDKCQSITSDRGCTSIGDTSKPLHFNGNYWRATSDALECVNVYTE